MFICLLFIFFEGNKEKWESAVKANPGKPLLGMFWVTWCGHCHKARPIFMNVVEEFRNNTDILLSTVNCTEYPAFCRLRAVKAYPTFQLDLFGYTKQIKIKRTEENFRKLINNIIQYSKLDMSILQGKTRKNFPIYHFKVNKKDKKTKETLAFFIIQNPNFDTKTVNYTEVEGREKTEFSVQLSKDFYYKMDAEITPENLLDFIEKNSIALFGDWQSGDIKNLKKNFSILLTKNNDYDKYKTFAQKTYKYVSWGNDSGMKSSTFIREKLNIIDTDYPCVVIMQPNMHNFHICRNVDDKKNLDRCAKLIKDNKITFSNVKYDSKLRLSGDNEVRYLAKVFLISFFSVLAVCTITFVSVLFCISDCKLSRKIE